jgi:hypothetical protein
MVVLVVLRGFIRPYDEALSYKALGCPIRPQKALQGKPGVIRPYKAL